MATAVAQAGIPATRLPGRRFDHLFFSTMALLMLASVFLGFAHSYYLAGIFHAPLPSLVVHLHGGAFSCWILLLVTQTSLVAAGRVDIHRRLGIAGFLLACLMVILGVLTATDALARANGLPGDAKFFYIIPMGDMLNFAVLVAFAFRARTNPSVHKRLILLATIALISAAIFRWPFAFVYHDGERATVFSYVFLLAMVLYDFWSTRKIHRATLWGGAFLVLAQQIRIPIGHSAAWHSFATWMQSRSG